MDATLVLDQQPVATPLGHTVVRALLSIAGIAPESSRRTPLALALVLDRSGSMSGAPLIAARSAAAHAVERLHPDDVVSAVLFDHDVATLAEPAKLRHQRRLASQLRQIVAGGNTNLSGGWMRGRQHMETAVELLPSTVGVPRRVLLLTDGHANVGIVDHEILVDLARTARTLGITTSTIGVGDGYDDRLLRAMADAGGGNSWYVERPDQTHDVFAEELGNLLSVAAQGLTVTVTLQPGVEMFRIHSDWSQSEHEGAITFDLGDLYASEPKPLLFELLTRSEATGCTAEVTAPITVATLRITGFVLVEGGGVEQRTLSLPIAATLDGQAQMVPEVERAIVMALSAKAREDAAREQREGNAAGAAALMRFARNALESSPIVNDKAFMAEMHAESADLAQMESRYQDGDFSELDAKYQLQRAQNRRRGNARYDAALRREQSGE